MYNAGRRLSTKDLDRFRFDFLRFKNESGVLHFSFRSKFPQNETKTQEVRAEKAASWSSNCTIPHCSSKVPPFTPLRALMERHLSSSHFHNSDCRPTQVHAASTYLWTADATRIQMAAEVKPSIISAHVLTPYKKPLTLNNSSYSSYVTRRRF